MAAVLGISAFHHDSAAAIVVDGELLAAAQQERFSGRKHDDAFPTDSIRFCLEHAGTRLSALDAVVFYENPESKLIRAVAAIGRDHPNRQSLLSRTLADWRQRPDLIEERLIDGLRGVDPAFDRARLGVAEHQRSHAASAFFPSPFDGAAVLTIDGVGGLSTTTIHRGAGAALEELKTIAFPDSLGLLYGAFTAYLGFKVDDGEHKVMGLAALGKPVYADMIKEKLVRLHGDGSFSINQEYFDCFTAHRMFNDRFVALFGRLERFKLDPPEPFHMDVAASIQAVITEAVLGLARMAVETASDRRLCMAGGVALNSAANGALVRSGIVDALWVQPAAGDAGGAIGAAFLADVGCGGTRRRPPAPPRDGMAGAYLGQAFSQADIERFLGSIGASYQVAPNDEAVIAETVSHLAAGRLVGWAQGRMEFGPCALGSRSIFADPRNPEVRRTLNLKLKDREAFRAFVAAVPLESGGEWFEVDGPSPHGSIAVPLREAHRLAEADGPSGLDRLDEPRSVIPAVTDVDGTARVQTVDRATNPMLHRLISEFGKATGVPVLANAGFSINNQPFVRTPEDAYRCFLGTQIDVLVLGRCILRREAQRVRLPIHLSVVRSERYQPESLWFVQWYAGGITHALNNRHTDMILQNASFHQGPVTRYETFADWMEAAARASRGAVLIITCGGSHTAGSVNWPYFLERELAALGFDDRIVVINLGQGAYCTFDSTLLLEAFLARAAPYGIKPRLVVSLDGFTDILMRVYSYIRQLRDGDADSNPMGIPQENVILERAGLHRDSDAIECPALMPLLRAAPGEPVEPVGIRLAPAVEDDILRRFRATLRELRAVCAARDIPCVNILQPILLPSHATLPDFVRRMLAYAGTPVPDGAPIDLRQLSRPVWTYKLRRHVEDIFSTGVPFQRDIGGAFQIRLEPIFAECWKLWWELGAAAERLDFINLLHLFSEHPYGSIDVDAIHYFPDGSRRIAAQLAMRLIERRDVYLDTPTGQNSETVAGIRLLRQLFGQYGKDVAIKSLDQLRATAPGTAIDQELQALLAVTGDLATARSLDPASHSGPDDALKDLVTLCVEASPPGDDAFYDATTSWREPDDGARHLGLAEKLRACASARVTDPVSRAT